MSTATLRATPSTLGPHPADVWRALTHRFLRHGWQSWLMLPLLLCGLPTLMYLMIRMIDPAFASTGWDDPASIRRLYFIFTLLLPTLIQFEMIQLRPLYALPLTTRRIVNTQLLLGSVNVAILHLLTVAYYRIVFSAPIPVLGPLVFLLPMVCIGAGIAALWIDAVWWRPIAGAAVLFGFAIWLSRRLSDEVLRADDSWFTPTPAELILLLAMAGAGYAVAYHTAVRDRRGDTGRWADLEEYLHRLGVWISQPSAWSGRSLPARALAPDDPRGGSERSSRRLAQAAYASYEWQTRGLVLPIVVSGIGLLLLIAAWYEPREWFRAYTLSLPVLLVFAMGVNGYIVGLLDGPKLNGEMDRYRATRPLSDTQIARVLLRNGVIGTGAALLISLGLALLVYLFALVCGHSHRELWSEVFAAGRTPVENIGLSLAGLAAGALAGWAAMGFNLTTLAAGRHWILPAVWLTGTAVMVGSILLGSAVGEERMDEITRAGLLLLSGLSATLTILCYSLAIRHGLLGPRSWLVLGALWTLGAAMLIAALQHLTTTASVVVTLFGLGSLVALPVASVPLAVWWNRHR